VLIVGQKLSTGSATSAQIYAVDSVDSASALGGASSQIAQMVKAYKAVDSLTQVYICPLSDHGSGVAASGSITWSGTATESGALTLYIGGRRTSVAVATGDTAATIETNALDALALTDDLPVTVAADSGTGVDLTARQKGTAGNQIMLGVALGDGERVPAGITVTVTAMASGATDPAHSAAVTAMGEDPYATVVMGLVDSTETGAMVTELESRFGAMRAIEGSLFAAKYDTRANLTSLGNGYNSAMFCLIGAEKSALLPLPWELAARVAAMDAMQAQTDPGRATGGQKIPGVRGAHRGSRFTRAQRDTLLSDGITTVVTTRDGALTLERLITTYQTNALSVPDTKLRDQQRIRLFDACRYSTRVRLGTKFARFKLVADGASIPIGQPMTNPKGVKAEVCALASEWEKAGWIQDLKTFVAECYVEIDGSDTNRVNIILPPNFVDMLLVAAAKISF
jgi:phage tail sheath gpL-like